ncbi:hypothetical protein ACFVIM_03040 [Streptomyces sp. NPDC057638]|uniref:hypothetical protein n=1 Tax=Streptomyces sp. NPDC057638 TaxID=3346190 RepID=UPI0036B442F9
MKPSTEARRFLSRLSGARGVAGVLLMQKADPGPEGADLVPGDALRWPKCRCGSERCPDYVPQAERTANGLLSRLVEVNQRSRRGKP